MAPGPGLIDAVGVVVIVEDDAGDALLAQEYLAEASDGGVRTVWTRSVAEALSVVTPATDCVLLDLGLPDLDGLAALAALTEAAPNVPVVVLTGLGERSTGMAAVAAGAEDFLVKNEVTPDALLRSVRYAIERRRNDRRERQLFEAELRRDENRRLARGLLPTPQLRDPAVRSATTYAPADAGALLGGDFVDAVELADGTLRVVIGDVCGHGPEEAALGACLRIAWRTLVLAGRDPGTLHGTLEQLFAAERHDDSLFTTLCDVSISPDRRRATLQLAGHEAPILVHEGRARILDASSGPLIGVGLPSGPVTEVDLPATWALLLFTDGIFEGRVGGRGERLGVDGLLAMVQRLLPDHVDARGMPTGSLLDALLAAAEATHGGPLADDVALFLLATAPR